MAYSEELANRVREELAQVEDLGEIKMYAHACIHGFFKAKEARHICTCHIFRLY